MHPDALSGRSIWHLHRGWFEAAERGEVLVNQNFDATEAIAPGKTVPCRTVGILTKVDLRENMYPIDDQPTLVQLDLLHEISKRYFVSAVQPDILRSVGIS